MFGVGISFMLMGSAHFFIKHLLKQEQPAAVQSIRLNLFFTGVAIIILSIISLALPVEYTRILPAIPIVYLCIVTIRLTHHLRSDK